MARLKPKNRYLKKSERDTWYCQKCGQRQSITDKGLRVKKRGFVLKVCGKCAKKYTIDKLKIGSKLAKRFIQTAWDRPENIKKLKK